MGNYKNLYKTEASKDGTGNVEQLLQLLRIVWDGDLIDKNARNELVQIGLAEQSNGFNFITGSGISFLKERGLIHP